MRRQEGRGGRRGEESEKMKSLLKEMKNEKVAKGRIIGLAGPCFSLFLSFFLFYFLASFLGSGPIGDDDLYGSTVPYRTTTYQESSLFSVPASWEGFGSSWVSLGASWEGL